MTGFDRLRRAAVLAAAFLAAAPAAAAQTGDTEFSTKETRAVTHGYAKCVVKAQPVRAAAAIRDNVDNATILRKYPQLIVGDCLRNSSGRLLTARFTGDLYRYALADALVSRDLAAFDPQGFSTIARLDHRDPGTAPSTVDRKGRTLSAKKYQAARDSHQQAAAFSYLSRYGECVVRTAPSAAKDLLLVKPDSDEEGARFRALGGALATCMPEGETMRFGRVTLRGTIAVNYYRLAMAARAAAPGTAG